MAVQVLSCLLLTTVLFTGNALSKGGSDDLESSSELVNCTKFLCRVSLTPCVQSIVTASNLTGSIDMTFSSNFANCSGVPNREQTFVSVTRGSALQNGAIRATMHATLAKIAYKWQHTGPVSWWNSILVIWDRTLPRATMHATLAKKA